MTKCATCGSEGFARSVLGADRCSFCDGTEGGNPPSLPLSRFPDAVLDLLAATKRGEMQLGELYSQLTAAGWRLGDLTQFEHNLCDAGFSTRRHMLFPQSIRDNIIFL